MNKNAVIHHFGSQKAVAEALGISQPAIAKWGDLVPEKQALRLHMLTGGLLAYKPEAYPQVSERSGV